MHVHTGSASVGVACYCEMNCTAVLNSPPVPPSCSVLLCGVFLCPASGHQCAVPHSHSEGAERVLQLRVSRDLGSGWCDRISRVSGELTPVCQCVHVSTCIRTHTLMYMHMYSHTCIYQFCAHPHSSPLHAKQTRGLHLLHMTPLLVATVAKAAYKLGQNNIHGGAWQCMGVYRAHGNIHESRLPLVLLI